MVGNEADCYTALHHHFMVAWIS